MDTDLWGLQVFFRSLRAKTSSIPWFPCCQAASRASLRRSLPNPLRGVVPLKARDWVIPKSLPPVHLTQPSRLPASSGGAEIVLRGGRPENDLCDGKPVEVGPSWLWRLRIERLA